MHVILAVLVPSEHADIGRAAILLVCLVRVLVVRQTLAIGDLLPEVVARRGLLEVVLQTLRLGAAELRHHTRIGVRSIANQLARLKLFERAALLDVGLGVDDFLQESSSDFG